MSDIAICNRALDMLGVEPLVSLADNTKAARLCVRNFEPVRDAVLRSYPWNAAVRSASLETHPEAPAWGYARQFKLPDDCLRLVGIEGAADDAPLAQRYRIEGRRVLTDEPAPLKVSYIARATTDELDPSLSDVIATRLAADLSYSLTASASLGQALMEMYQAKKTEAEIIDAQEREPVND